MSVFKDFPGLENLEKNSRTFKDFQGPARALLQMRWEKQVSTVKIQPEPDLHSQIWSRPNLRENDCT